MIETKDHKFKRGHTVICIINSRSYLTVGKEYTIKDILDGVGSIELLIENDKNSEYWYTPDRFMTKDKYREITINQILK